MQYTFDNIFIYLLIRCIVFNKLYFISKLLKSLQSSQSQKGYKNLNKTLNKILFKFSHEKNGGAKQDRTADLLDANQALSQLSYSPN